MVQREKQSMWWTLCVCRCKHSDPGKHHWKDNTWMRPGRRWMRKKQAQSAS